MSDMDGVRLTGPPAHPQVRRKMPAPYRRDSVNLGAPPQARREWRQVLAADLRPGDTVPGIGVLHEVREAVIGQEIHGLELPQWTVWLTGGDGNVRTVAGTDTMLAFVLAPPDR